MSLKDANQLVKLYAMVNVAQYQVVATGQTVAQCETNYLDLLSRQGITQAPQPDALGNATGILSEIRTAVIGGNTVYYLRLEEDGPCYTISAADQGDVVLLNEGDLVTLYYAPFDPESPPALVPVSRVEVTGP